MRTFGKLCKKEKKKFAQGPSMSKTSVHSIKEMFFDIWPAELKTEIKQTASDKPNKILQRKLPQMSNVVSYKL